VSCAGAVKLLADDKMRAEWYEAAMLVTSVKGQRATAGA
jgi:hypothetical protein